MAVDRDKALGLALGQIEKQFGKGAVMRMGEDAKVRIAAIPTGALALDVALGIGGLPRGRVVEVFGPESSGKTTVALHAIAEAQKLGGIAAFIDAEHALDPAYAAALGVDVEALLVSQPDTGEQAPRDHRHARPVGGGGHPRHRLGGGADAPRRDRRRDGRHPRRPPGPAHVAGAAQARRQPQPLQDLRRLHQPAPREDRRDVRVTRNDPWREGAQSSTRRCAWTSGGSSR